MEINEEAKKKPTKSINKILDDKGKDAIKFLIDSGFDRDEATVIIPDLKNVETTAYRHRQQVIPRQPKGKVSSPFKNSVQSFFRPTVPIN